jgi:hypothetical protein
MPRRIVLLATAGNDPIVIHRLPARHQPVQNSDRQPVKCDRLLSPRTNAIFQIEGYEVLFASKRLAVDVLILVEAQRRKGNRNVASQENDLRD